MKIVINEYDNPVIFYQSNKTAVIGIRAEDLNKYKGINPLFIWAYIGTGEDNNTYVYLRDVVKALHLSRVQVKRNFNWAERFENRFCLDNTTKRDKMVLLEDARKLATKF